MDYGLWIMDTFGFLRERWCRIRPGFFRINYYVEFKFGDKRTPKMGSVPDSFSDKFNGILFSGKKTFSLIPDLNLDIALLS
jgi:hypothetical protein